MDWYSKMIVAAALALITSGFMFAMEQTLLGMGFFCLFFILLVIVNQD